MILSDFDFSLPQELIAQYPLEKREEARLLVLHRKTKKIEHRRFKDIVEYFKSNDVLVMNETKVFPARLFGKKETGGKVELLLVRKVERDIWTVLIKPHKMVKIGTKIIFENIDGEIVGREDSGNYLVKFNYEGNFDATVDRIGTTPLPPYIKRAAEEEDKIYYQTVYAKQRGAIAAPTAGLHFTEDIIKKINEKAKTVTILLHIGLGTFKPIKSKTIGNHKMDKEYFEIDEDTAYLINNAKREKERVFAVGTSSVRAIETAIKLIDRKWGIGTKRGWTEKFIYPPYEFKIVDALITNFHLPRSTPFLLVSAFATRELILESYKEAIEKRYRFYSYGDAMLIL